MTDLNKLAERAEAGEKISRSECRMICIQIDVDCCFGGLDNTCEAFNGSLDAAKALHDAVLPGWGWYIDWDNNTTVALNKLGKAVSYEGMASKPAAAWVAAILRAKAQEAE